jgi:hypothetical protein
MSDDTEQTIDATVHTKCVIADSTGRITQRMMMPASMVELQTPPTGGSVVIGDGDWNTHYVVNGAIAPRPTNPAAQNGTVLSNLPSAATVTINGIAYTVDDGTLEMTFPNAGTYAITVSCFPYLDAAFTHTQ